MQETRLVGEDDWGDLLEAARQGEHWALTELYRRHQPELLRFLYALVPAEAEDLASDTWIDAARALARFEGDARAFRGLLFTIGRRRAVDLSRARRRRRSEPADHEQLDALPEGTGGAATDVGETVAEIDAGRRAVRRIAAVLPRAQAEVVLLRVVAGLSVAEVAEVLGKQPAQVSVLQSRGLKRLAAYFERTAGAPGDSGTSGRRSGKSARSTPPAAME